MKSLVVVCLLVGFVTQLATIKTTMSFKAAFIRGILCNWLVTTAVWLGQASSDLLSKVFMICVLITIFVTLQFEHSVANMFVGAMGAMVGGPNFADFFVKNLIPVTLGNIVGGGVFTAGISYLAWGSYTTPTMWWRQVQKRRRTMEKDPKMVPTPPV